MTIKRRSLIYGMGTAPFIAHFGLASSGSLSIAMFEDELDPNILVALERDTGIKVQHIKCTSNEEIMQQANSVDLVAPTTTEYLKYQPSNLLTPLMDAKIVRFKININRQMLDYVEKNWNFGKGNTLLPHVWGTEGIAWRNDLWKPKSADGRVSYGDLYNPEVKGKAFARVSSLIYSAGIYLDSIGKIPTGSVLRSYGNPDIFDKTWPVVMKFLLPLKKQFGTFWAEGGEEQKDAFTKKQMVIGQTWDNPPLALKATGQKISYQAPKEGAITWIDGIAITKANKDSDAAYQFMEYLLRRDLAGKAIDYHHYNSVVNEAEKFASGTYSRNFLEVFPGDSLVKLHLWQAEPEWYTQKFDNMIATYTKAKA